MSGLTPLVDTLLATRLAQRLDLLPLKSEPEIASPGSVIRVKKVDNELHLPSRAGLQQPVGVGLLKSGATGHGQGQGPARAGEAVTLSVAARAVSAILASQDGASTKITGTEPLWSAAQSVQAPLLAATLAAAVANSGLFYESHLAQYAAGTRPLAQLAQEPQARLGAAPSGAQAEAPPDPDLPLPAAGMRAVVASAGQGAVAGAGQGAVAGAAAADPTEGPRPAGPAGAMPAPVAEAIHPEAMPLVRQQLELLTLPLFRWTGEAWPGAPMDWEIQEEQGERQAAAEPQAVAGAWTTRLAIRLPALGAVDLRLTLAGSTLRVHLAARESATVALLTEGGHALPPRLGALGLQLAELQIGALADAPLLAS
ncbi:MAG: flagellar hook-length control protein FliK [Rhodoferax sp.]|nr:flagellar hook-length control protein FliK [Rhodoferax sp.]